jgi:ABC-type multidrug transport system fused ATPase/permease subunit
MAVHQNTRIAREIKNIGNYVEKHRQSHLKTWRYFEIILSINSLMASVMLVTVVFTALFLWQGGVITVGVVVLAIMMVTRLVGDLVFIGSTFNRFMEQYGQLQEGLEEIFVPYEIEDIPKAKRMKIKKGEIVFDKVNFRYRDDKNNAVFKNLSLTIPAGQKVGLVGESGAGKSTFVSLLLRFMDVDSGAIKIDDYKINEIRQNSLRSAIAYVPQEALLFHRSIEDNIKYSNPKAGREKIIQATQRAYALDFIKKLPRGFKTLVGERGVKLSGGQKQRVMIARAMLKKSPILVLDEATSSLDSKAEQQIQKALEILMQDRTTIVIAHRLSTLKQMDRIIVFAGGRIVEDGTHDDLLKQKGKYYELWQHQTS